VLTAADLRRAPFDPGSVPAGVLSRVAVLGRTTAGPLRAGEPLTDARVLTASLLDRYPGLVAVPVRIADAGAVGLLRVGDRVDLLAADPQRPHAEVVGRDVPVLALPPTTTDDSPDPAQGALVVVGLPRPSALTAAQAGVSSYLSVVLTPPR
jgi:Flp pilus assembly protein CpaB